VAVTSRSNRLRISLALLALLPGLLLQGGETLRVCLHDWIEFQDDCQEAAAPSSPAVAPGGDCCAEDEAGPEGPALAGGHECGACCIELGSESRELSPPPTDDGHAHGLAVPVQRVVALLPAAPHRGLTPRTPVLAHAPPGRAPTPLRI